jgi:hypothetical protein
MNVYGGLEKMWKGKFFTFFEVLLLLRVVLHKASHALRPLLIYFASPSEFSSFLIYPSELSGYYQQRHLEAEQDNLGEKWP